jgi:peptide/nickel transport system substrate-binding protein
MSDISSSKDSINSVTIFLDNQSRQKNIDFNTKESLISFNEILQKIPSLATSWGSPDDKTLIFDLREGVRFHNNQPFTADNVIDSFKKTSFVVKKINDYRVEFTLDKDNPTILDEISKVKILNDGFGTGPFIYKNQKLEINNDYWGDLPQVLSASFTEKKESADLVVNSLDKKMQDFYSKKVIPSVSPVLLSYNFNEESITSSNKLRFIIESSISRDEISQNIKNKASFLKGFIPSSIFGHQGDLKDPKFNKDKAINLYKKTFPESLTLSMFSPQEHLDLAKELKSQLEGVGMFININPPDVEEYDLFLVQMKYTTSNSIDLLFDFFHTKGENNRSLYSDLDIDTTIEKIKSITNPQDRIDSLRDLQLQLAQKRVALPIYEPMQEFFIRREFSWQPRLDKLIDLKTISK